MDTEQELINQVKDLIALTKDLQGQTISLRQLTQRHEKEIKQLQISLAQTRHALAERLAYK